VEISVDFILLISQRLGHIVVDDDVNLFHINTSSEKIGGDQDSTNTFLELSIFFNSRKELIF